MSSRTYNVIRNSAWSMINKSTNILIPFISRTILLKVLGADYLGLNSLFLAILNVLSLAELGISNAIVASLYKPIADKDTRTICALIAFYRSAYRVIGGVILVIGLVLLPFIECFIKGEYPSSINIYVLYIIYLLNTVISYYGFAHKKCLFIAHQRNDICMKTETLVNCSRGLVQIALIVLYQNYYIYAIVIPVFTFAYNLLIGLWARETYPAYICEGTVSTDMRKQLKTQVTGLLFAKISATIRSSIDSLFISIFCGLVSVAMYNNYFYIVTAVSGVLQMLEGNMVAGVGDSIVSESIDKNYADFKKFTFMLQWIVSFFAICILCLIQPFMNIWVGKELMYNEVMAIICSMYVFVLNISLVRSIYTQATGMWWQLRILSLIDVFVNSILNLILIMKFDVYGVLLASVLDILFVSIPWTTYYLFKDYFGIKKYKSYMVQLFQYFAIYIGASVLTYGLCMVIPNESNWLTLVLRCIICMIVPNIVFFLTYHNNELFQESKNFVLRMMKKSEKR